MTDRPDPRHDLDRLWDDVPVGSPDLTAALRGGTRLRRRRQTFGAMTVTAALVLGIGAGTTLWPRPDETPAPAPAAPAPTATDLGEQRMTLYYLLDEPVAEGAPFEQATLITPRSVEVESTGDPGYDALHALLTLEPPAAGLTEGFNVLDQPGADPTIDVASVTHADGVVRVELTGTPYDPYPAVDFCCPSDGEAVAQQVVHTVQAALDTTDPVEFNGRGIWLEELDDPVEADPDVVVPPEGSSSVANVDLPTSQWRRGQDAMTARLEGVLGQDETGCAVVQSGDGPVYPVWPAGWSGWDTPDGVVLLDAEGRLVAREGDRIVAGGGEPAVFDLPGCIPRTASSIFFVQSDLSLIR